MRNTAVVFMFVSTYAFWVWGILNFKDGYVFTYKLKNLQGMSSTLDK